MGTPLGPDPRFSDDLQAIDDYVNGLSAVGHQLSAVNEYKGWRDGLGWADVIANPNETMRIANEKVKRIDSPDAFGVDVTSPIDPYVPFTGLGEYIFNDDINAITTYIENQRPNIRKWPKLQGMIEAYEKWLKNLNWWDKYINPGNTLGQAVTQRNAINKAMGNIPDPSWDIADAGRIVPEKVVNKSDAWTPPSFNEIMKTFLYVGAGAVGLVLLIGGIRLLPARRQSPQEPKSLGTDE